MLGTPPPFTGLLSSNFFCQGSVICFPYLPSYLLVPDTASNWGSPGDYILIINGDYVIISMWGALSSQQKIQVPTPGTE